MGKARFVLVVALVALALVAVVPAAGASPDIGGKSIESSEDSSGKGLWAPNLFFSPVRYCPLDAAYCSWWFPVLEW